MKIEIDLNELGFRYDEEGEPEGEVTLRDEVIRATVDKLWSPARLRAIDQKIEEIVSSKMQGVIDDEVKKRIESLFEKPLQRTNSWGEKRGEPVTILEMIEESITEYLTKSGRSSRDFNRDPKNLQELIQDTTKNLLTTELSDTIKQAKAEVHQTVTKKALEAAVAVLAK